MGKFTWRNEAKRCFQKFVDNTQQYFAFTFKANFPMHNLNFYWRLRWWNRIQATFWNLFYFIKRNTFSLYLVDLIIIWKDYLDNVIWQKWKDNFFFLCPKIDIPQKLTEKSDALVKIDLWKNENLTKSCQIASMGTKEKETSMLLKVWLLNCKKCTKLIWKKMLWH